MERWNRKERKSSLGKGLSSQVWPVYRDYRIQDGVVRPVGGAPRLYFPMAHPTLPFKLGVLAEGQEESILEFARTWGLLGHDHLKGKEERLGGDPLDFMLRQAEDVRDVLGLLEQTRGRGDKGFWAHLPSYIPLDGIRPRLYTVSGEAEAYEQFIQGFDEDSRVSESIIVHVEHGPARAGNRVGVRIELRWRALIDVIYWHLATYAAGERDWGRCEECGSFFERTDPRQRFCPSVDEPYVSRRQSPCGLRYRSRKQRQQKQRPTTPQEILP